MIMTADAIRVTLFPAMMALAASSDLLTMTISNRLSLILLGGFFVLAAITGMSATDMHSHLSAGCVVLDAAFGLFARGISRGGGTVARLRSPFALSLIGIAPRWRAERGADLVPNGAHAGVARAPRVGRAAAREGCRGALW